MITIIVIIIWLGCIVTIYRDAWNQGAGFPKGESNADQHLSYFEPYPGGWAFAVLILGPIGTFLYSLKYNSRTGWMVLIIQIALIIVATRVSK